MSTLLSPAGSLTHLGLQDITHHLHSQTNLALHTRQGPLIIVKGEGPYVFDEQGNRYLEGMSGLWCASLGFSSSRLVEAATRQLRRLPYYHTFNHRATDVVARLAAKVQSLVPQHNARVFFASSGSEANDSMVKLAWYYHAARGKTAKRKVIAREGGFHGSTVMGASLSGLKPMHDSFGLPIEGVLHVSSPNFYRNAVQGENQEVFTDRLVAELESTIAKHGADTIAAFIAEPVMGAGGVVVPPPGYFEKIQAVLRKHDILLLSDEIVCGFGRTGNWFGCQTFGFEPDMMTCAKGLSSGYMPISCVVIAEHVYQAVEQRSGQLDSFGHGFTYSGHPVAAAVALEALTAYEEMDIPAVSRRLGARLHQKLQQVAEHPLVGEVRGVGFVAGIELVANKETRSPFATALRVGVAVEKACRARGIIVRNMGDVIALCPPYILQDEEVDLLAGLLHAALDDVAASLPGASA